MLIKQSTRGSPGHELPPPSPPAPTDPGSKAAPAAAAAQEEFIAAAAAAAAEAAGQPSWWTMWLLGAPLPSAEWSVGHQSIADVLIPGDRLPEKGILTFH